MLNFSKTGLINDLVKDIQALTPEGNSQEQDLYELAKEAAIKRLESLYSDTTNAAHINLRAAIIWPLNAQQLEIQIQGRKM